MEESREPIVFHVTQEEIDLLKIENSCTYNIGVSCMDRHNSACKNCGWNPLVSRRRIRKIRKELGL